MAAPTRTGCARYLHEDFAAVYAQDHGIKTSPEFNAFIVQANSEAKIIVNQLKPSIRAKQVPNSDHAVINQVIWNQFSQLTQNATGIVRQMVMGYLKANGVSPASGGETDPRAAIDIPHTISVTRRHPPRH